MHSRDSIARIVAQVLDIECSKLDLSKSFIALGGDSLSAIDFLAKCRNDGIHVDFANILKAGTVAELVEIVLQNAPLQELPNHGGGNRIELSSKGAVDERYVLHQRSRRFRIELKDEASPISVRRALQEIVTRHTALRTTVTLHSAYQWELNLVEDIDDVLILEEHQGITVDESERIVERIAQKLDLQNGPILGAVLFDRALVLVAHNFAVDTNSWRTIARELSACWESSTCGHEPEYMYRRWLSSRRHEQAALDFLSPQESPCTSQPLPAFPPTPPHQSLEQAVGLESSTIHLLHSEDLHAKLRTTPSHILLAALTLCAGKLGADILSIFNVFDGRGSDPNFVDAVGCFDQIVDFRLQRQSDQSDVDLVRKVKDSTQGHSEAEGLTLSPDFFIALDSTALASNSNQDWNNESSRAHGAWSESLNPVQHANAPYVQVLVRIANGSFNLCLRSSEDEYGRWVLSTFADSIGHIVERVLLAVNASSLKPTMSDFPRMQCCYTTLDVMFGRLSTLLPHPLISVEDITPCSPMQESIIISQKLNNQAYMCRFQVRITSSSTPGETIDRNRVLACWKQLVQRHSILRTMLVESDYRPGHYDQITWRHSDPRFTYTQEAIDECSSASSKRFSTWEVPHHLVINQIDPAEIELTLDISHALIDGQSAQVLFKDFCDAWLGKALRVETLPYIDFVRYQHQLSSPGASLYWSEYLQEVQESHLIMTTDQVPQSSPQSIQKKHKLPPAVLEDFCNKRGVTAATVCQLAWALVLRSNTCSEDTCFSYVDSGRQAPLHGIDGAVGLFVSTLPCRVDFSSTSSAADLLDRIRTDHLRSISHQHAIPSPSPDSKSSISRKCGNSILSFQRGSSKMKHPQAGLEIEVLNRSTPTDYDVTLNVHMHESSLTSTMEFWGSRLSLKDAESLHDMFHSAIEHVLLQPDTSVKSFPMPTSDERIRLARQVKNIIPRSDKCLHDIIRSVRLQQPGAPAVCAWDGQLTYRELDNAASTVAQYLRTLGVCAEAKVGICMDKSVWAVVAILAVLQAGGVVVPLGVDAPLMRITRIIEDAPVRVVLTDDGNAKRLESVAIPLVHISQAFIDELPPIATMNGVALPPVMADNAAWIVYTSGSTGTPKGSVLEHANLCSSIECHGKWLGFGRNTRTFQFAAHTFDVAIQDFMTTLCYGGCICIPSERDRVNDLASVINQMQVNFAALTPTVASIITPAQVPSLSTLVFVGEAGKPAVIETWLGHATLFNGYGPSECSIYNAITRPLKSKQEVQVIGFPVGCCFWVVEPSNYHHLSGSGVGELVIEGPHLGRGYLNDAEKTAASFIMDPGFVEELGLSPGRRMYRSGDLVRQNDDGSITFLSRLDQQIKVRGQRVEAGEIEHHISTHPAVQIATVVYLKKGMLSGHLVAAVTLHGFAQGAGSGPSIIQLAETEKASVAPILPDIRRHISQQVVPYMVPSHFIPLAMMPLNSSAKVDRMRLGSWIGDMDSSALAALSHSDQGSSDGTPYIASATDQSLREVWAKALGMDAGAVPYNRSFLSLGGDSVTAMKVVSMCRANGICVDVGRVLQCQAIPELAAVRDVADEDSETESLPDSAASPCSASLTEEEKAFLRMKLLRLENVEHILPCSPIQSGFLLSQLKAPHTYWLKQSCRVHAAEGHAIDVQRLAEAWRRVCAQHAILRTAFVEQVPNKEGFHQIVFHAIDAEIVLETVDDAARVHGLLDVHPPLSPFGISPAHRLTITTALNGQVYCGWHISHALVDAASVEQLAHEFLECYDSLPVPKSGPQYSSYISFLQGTSLAADSLYWQKLLAGLEPCHLPALGAAAELARNDQGSKEQLSRRLADLASLHRFRDTHGVTVACIFQLAWALVLSAYTNNPRVCFGYLSSARNLPIPNAHRIVGPMINMLVCSASLDHDRSVLETLLAMQNRFIEDSKHQSSPLSKVQHEVQPNGSNLFNTTLAYERKRNPQPVQRSSVSLEPLAGDDITEYPVAIHIAAGSDDVDITLKHITSLVSTSHADRLLNSLLHVVDLLSHNALTKIGELQTISSCDATTITSWSGSGMPRLQACVHELVAEVAGKQPHAMAIDSWDGSMTYGELQVLASTLAHHLASLGIGRDEQGTVGLCMKKSKWAVIAMLAVLQAGGVVVPLGTSDPPSRIHRIVEQAATKVLLTDDVHRDRLRGFASNVVVVNSTLLDSLPSLSERACPAVKPDHLAWVIFTSGSTGIPKGVMLEHGAISSIVTTQSRIIGSGPQTRRFQFAAFTFDVSIADVFTTLTSGGAICIPSEEQRLDNVGDTINAMGANFAQLTSTVAGMIDPAKTSLKGLVLGGEAVSPAVFRSWIDKVAVQNGYGPAEGTITASHSFPLTDERMYNNVGFPLVGRFWITQPDDFHRLVPVGVVGEILIDSPILARGYLHDAEKTEASFVIDPAFVKQLGLSTGRRMYRTGDLAKQNEDGSLVMVGRRDTQVKIRGLRVEIGEIETWITKLFANASGVVVDVIRRGNQSTIFAAVQLANCEGCTTNHPSLLKPSNELQASFSNLREALFEVLPAYMVPSVFVPMAQLPLNASGKQDRRAVRETLYGLSQDDLTTYNSLEVGKVEPATDTERRLQALWAVTLDRAPHTVGANDHFFHSGGDSVTAMRMVAVGRKARLRITVADIFQYPRLSDHARILEEQADDQDEEDVSPFALLKDRGDVDEKADLATLCGVRPSQIEDAYPCTPLQEGLMAITAQQPGTYTEQRVFRLNGSISISQFKAAWERLVELVPILRTRIVSATGSTAMQVIVQQPLQWLSGSSLNSYLSDDRSSPMSYGDPLCRLALIEGSRTQYLVWTVHHSIYDGWSSQKMLEQLAALMKAEPLPRPVPMSRFVKHLGLQDPEQARDYWRQQLTGASMNKFPELPYSSFKPCPDQKTQLRIYRDQSPSEITTAMILRAAWAVLVAAHTDSDEAVFNVALSGRNAPVNDILHLIAPTITTVPVRIAVDQQQTVSKFLSSVQEQATNMMPFEHTGLQNIRRLVPELGPNFDPGHTFTVQTALDDRNEQARSLYADIGMEREDIPGSTFHSYALVVECITYANDSAIDVQARFDGQVLPPDLIQLLLQQFAHIFNQFSVEESHETRTIEDLNLVSGADIAKLRSFDFGKATKIHSCIHDVVHEVAVRQPDATAVCAWDGDLSYAELDRAASVLAHFLVDTVKITPGAIVGMCMDKSKFAVIAILAILQAGGVVVPLGVQHPVSRIHAIVQEADATLVIADKQQAVRLDGLLEHVLVFDAPFLSDLLAHNSTLPRSIVTAESPAWIIFTSGSTGKPKGVVLEHHAISTIAEAQGRLTETGKHTRRLQFAAYTFDVSIGDTFTVLTYGGCLCIPSEDDRMNRLAQVINDMSVNFLYLTSTVAGLLDPAEVPSVRVVTLGGEPVSSVVLEKWLPHVVMRNAYGPAECTITAFHTPPISNRTQNSWIGYPLASRPWVVSARDYNRLVPIGCPGELLIQGPTLSPCYFKDPEKTRAAYITSPSFLAEVGVDVGGDARMYRTGDIVRQNIDGSLTIVGRRDAQIKVRGQRVETAEIEGWIKRFMPKIRMAYVDVIQRGTSTLQQTLMAAVALDIQPNRDQPMALLAPSDSLSVTFQELHASLQGVLPPFMVPNIYLPLPYLPLNASCKLDRMSIRSYLTSLDAAELNLHSLNQVSNKVVATKAEMTLRSLWSAALNIDESLIGRDDNLFHLGGDSIVAMELISRARTKQLRLTIRDVFNSPILRDMALLGRETQTVNSEEQKYEPFSLLDVSNVDAFLRANICNTTKMTRESIVDAYPTTDFQAQTIAANLSNARMELNCIAWTADGPHDIESLKQACMQLLGQIECLRTAFVFDHSRLLQVVLSSIDPSIIQTYTTDATLDMFTRTLMAAGMLRPPRIGQPLIDIAIISRRSTGQHRILFRLSHAIYGGPTLPQIWATLESLFAGKGVKSYPPFGRYIADVNRQIRPSHFEYWKTLLKGSSMPQIGALPSHFRQSASLVRVLEPVRIHLKGSSLTGVTSAILIKAAWSLVLAKQSNSLDVVFADGISGRGTVDPSASTALGCCVSGMPFRVPLNADWSIADLLTFVRDQQVQSGEYEALGFRQIFHDCTEWPRGTNFTSYVNHRQGHRDSYTLGENTYTPSFVASPEERSLLDVTITSHWTTDPNDVEITLRYAVDNVSEALARDLMAAIGATLVAIPTHLEAHALGFLRDLELSTLRPAEESHLRNGARAVEKVDDSLAERIQTTWSALSQQQFKDTSLPWPASLDRRPDWVDAAQVAFFLYRGGHATSVEAVYSTLLSSNETAVKRE